MQILENRDIIKDELGNYYVASVSYGKQLTLVNAVVYYSFNRILNNEFVEEVNKNYEKSVAVGQFFNDLVKGKLERLESAEFPGNIYQLKDVIENGYVVKVDGLYEKSVNI